MPFTTSKEMIVTSSPLCLFIHVCIYCKKLNTCIFRIKIGIWLESLMAAKFVVLAHQVNNSECYDDKNSH